MAETSNAADVADTVSEDFALPESAVDSQSEGDDLTPEDIEEWANVESPVVASFPSSQSDRDVTDGTPKHDSETGDANAKLLDEATAAAAALAGTPEPASESGTSRLASTPTPAAATSSSTTATGADAPSGSESWGWGGGWGWQKLRQAAAEAAKDVAELKESFQQVLAEVATPDADEEESPAPAPRPAARAAPSPQQDPVELAKKKEVLQRLEGPDTQLEVGLKAIDDQMEQLATGAAKALTSLWGGLAVVAKGTITTGHSIATKVENATLELAKELVQSVEEGVKDASTGLKGVSQLASRAERSLETVGRTAMDFLEEAAGHRSGPLGEGEGGSSFEGCFHSYGGRRAYEELEGLANECSRLCNRTRARLAEDQKAAVDDTLVELGPLFDLVASESDPGAPAPAEAPTSDATPEEPAAASKAAAEPAGKDEPADAAPELQQQQGGQQQQDEHQKAQQGAKAAGEAEGSAEAGQAVGAAGAPDQQHGEVGKGRRPAKEVEEQLKGEYAPVADLHEAGLRRVEALLEALRLEAAAGAAEKAAAEKASKDAPVEAMPEAAAPEATTDRKDPAAGAEAKEHQQEQKAAAEGSEATAEAKDTASSSAPKAPAASGEVLVRRMQQETVHCLAELCATELQLLLRLGRSIVAPARYGRPADDGIQWPDAAVAKAVLLHRTARRMAADIEASADVFLRALSAVEEMVAAQLLDQAAAQAAEAAVADLEVDCGTAAARVQEAFRNLLYIVVLSSLHSQGLLKA